MNHQNNIDYFLKNLCHLVSIEDLCFVSLIELLTQDFEGEYSDYNLKNIGIHISNPMVSHSLVKIELKASQLKYC